MRIVNRTGDVSSGPSLQGYFNMAFMNMNLLAGGFEDDSQDPHEGENGSRGEVGGGDEAEAIRRLEKLIKQEMRQQHEQDEGGEGHDAATTTTLSTTTVAKMIMHLMKEEKKDMKKREVEHKRKQLEDRRLETEGRVVDWELQQLQRMEQNLARSTGGKGQGKGAYAYRTGYASQFQPAMVPHLPLHYTTPLPRRQIRRYSPSLPSSLPASPTGPSTKQGYAFYGAFSAPSSPVAKESVVEKNFYTKDDAKLAEASKVGMGGLHLENFFLHAPCSKPVETQQIEHQKDQPQQIDHRGMMMHGLKIQMPMGQIREMETEIKEICKETSSKPEEDIEKNTSSAGAIQSGIEQDIGELITPHLHIGVNSSEEMAEPDTGILGIMPTGQLQCLAATSKVPAIGWLAPTVDTQVPAVWLHTLEAVPMDISPPPINIREEGTHPMEESPPPPSLPRIHPHF